MSEAKYLVGIDLGTSNCAMAYVEPAQGAAAAVADFAITQLERPGEVRSRPLLPSCIYLPGEHDLPPEATRLPWSEEPAVIVGECARWQGTRVPGRMVSSAKSWLCHPGVDRSAPILPWGAAAEVKKLSPVDASARLLAHMAQAWDSAHPDHPLKSQEVIVTVPASFDEVARALTVSAARQAGFEQFTLLEEPQAAFYDFTARHRSDLASSLEGVHLVLVVDVGGGTSDFTLVQIAVSPEGPLLRRVAVGEHLMLGGDNMDAALGRKAEERLLSGGRRLSAGQWSQLVQLARLAKESLLSQDAVPETGGHSARQPAEAIPNRYNISLVTEGSRLVGSSISTHVTRDEVESVVLDGFFPRCQPGDLPHKGARMALQELGLPYAQDPAVTRHLVGFLHAHARAGFAALGESTPPPGLPRPDAILLNGGVFNSPAITRRLVQVVSSWWSAQPSIPLLHHDSLDLAVARGAAFYGLVRRGLGRRIGGGAAHALYLGLERVGADTPHALCVIPRGQEEGETVNLGSQVFEVAVGRPVRFPLFSTSADRFERAGEVVPVSDDLQPLPPIHTLLKSSGQQSGNVPVHLQAVLTEIGTLELWCVSNTSNHRWRLEFELRGASANTSSTVTESMPASFAEARLWVERIFGKGHLHSPAKPTRTAAPKDVKQLWASLEQALGPREEWRVPVLRELWSAAFAGAARRRRSSDHERVFFQLLGYSLRPGFGYPLDEWRAEQSVRLFGESVQFHKDKAVWKEFWILWRRISGGLHAKEHQQVWAYLKPFLAARVPLSPSKNLPRPKGVQPEGTDEMVRLAASLEHLDTVEKNLLGNWICERLRQPQPPSGPWTWALGRLGARVPIYGSVHQVIDAGMATEWVRLLLQPGVLRLEGALFALTQLARLTGDRTRDLEEPVRREVSAALQAANASPSWQRMVTELVVLDSADKARALGDTLPVGLILPEGNAST